MDVLKIGEVIWRRKGLMVVAVIIGLCASFLSVNKLSSGHNGLGFESRSYTTYQTKLRVIVEKPGFEIGRSLDRVPQDSNPDPNRANALAITYAYLLTSDVVTQDVKKKVGNYTATVNAAPVEQAPIIELTVTGKDPDEIKKIAKQTELSFIAYLTRQQDASKVPDSDRMQVREVDGPDEAEALQSRTTEMALVAFMAPMALFGGLALVLENMKRRKTDGVQTRARQADR